MDVRSKRSEAGFVISNELLLVAVMLCLGLVTGWVKFRDQSLSEINDSMAAVDAYIQGSAPLWQTGGTRWIQSGAILEPGVTGSVVAKWHNGVDPSVEAPAAELVPGSPGTFRTREGFLIYKAPDGEMP